MSPTIKPCPNCGRQTAGRTGEFEKRRAAEHAELKRNVDEFKTLVDALSWKSEGSAR
jgi:hypothetical protein